MVDYNTHGGYFAPQGLMKINEGGSHEENPNGGVQLGVDQQGIPNLVEEDEMVYNDFVYSDNIKADGGFLEKNNLPKKYAGKFYSEIAEALCDEIGEQVDPISLNGLNASLGRLANSQEEQKAAEEEAELMKMLQEMSPEELAALEQALMEQQASEQPMVPEEQIQPEVVPEQVGAEEVAPEQIAPAIPMMAMGGPVNKFYGGGPGGGGRAGNFGQKALNLLRDVGEILSPIEQKEITMPDGNVVKVQYGIGNAALPENIAAQMARGERLIADAAKQKDKVVARSMVKQGKEMIRFAKKLGKPAANAAPVVAETVASTAAQAEPVAAATGGVQTVTPFLRRKGVGPFLARTGIGAGILTGLGAGAKYAIDTFGNPDVEGGEGGDYSYDPNDFAFGGRVNRYDWGSFLDRLKAYGVSRNPGGISSTYKIDRSFPLGNFSTIKELEDSENYRNFTDYVLNNSSDENVLNYLRMLDSETHSGVPKLFNGDQLRDNWADLYSSRRYDQKGGIYHFTPEDAFYASPAPAQPAPATPPIDPEKGLYVGHGMYMPMDLVNKANSVTIGQKPIDKVAAKDPNKDPNRGVTDNGARTDTGFDWRYLSPAIDAAMGLATLATPEDHYEYNPIRPYLPYGRIRQQYDRYNPLDQNMVTNQMQAQANATMAALRNAGLGPSTGTQLIGAGYAAGQNMGNALTNVWDANNQRYNQVVNQHNNADATTAQFDWGVESARANALNQFAPYNQRMALQTEILNNQAEQDKYNTIGSYVDSAKQFFANKGREDLNRNMVNSNRAFLGYGINRMNNVVYDKYGNPILLRRCGGSIKKK